MKLNRCHRRGHPIRQVRFTPWALSRKSRFAKKIDIALKPGFFKFFKKEVFVRTRGMKKYDKWGLDWVMTGARRS